MKRGTPPIGFLGLRGSRELEPIVFPAARRGSRAKVRAEMSIEATQERKMRFITSPEGQGD